MAANLNSFVSIKISLTDLTTLPPCYELNSAKQIKRLLYFLSRAEKKSADKNIKGLIFWLFISHKQGTSSIFVLFTFLILSTIFTVTVGAPADIL